MKIQLLNMKIDLKMKLNDEGIIDMFLQNANHSDTLFYLSETDRRSSAPSDKEKFTSGLIVSTMLDYLKRHRSFTTPIADALTS